MRFEKDIAEQLETDARGIETEPAAGFAPRLYSDGNYAAFKDEWGIGWRMPHVGGFYYDMYIHSLATAETLSDFKRFKFPDPLDSHRYQNLRRDAQAAVDEGKALILDSIMPGIVEVYSWLRGYEGFYTDLAVNQDIVGYILDRLVEFKCAHWERALSEVGDLVDAIIESEDMAGQQSLLFSPETYRKLVKPRQKKLFAFSKRQGPVKIFLHSCGAIRPLLKDLIEIGVDILNPVQLSAAGMDPKELKREFGQDLVFWGGGVETQRVLAMGTPAEVRANVRIGNPWAVGWAVGRRLSVSAAVSSLPAPCGPIPAGAPRRDGTAPRLARSDRSPRHRCPRNTLCSAMFCSVRDT